MEIKRKVIQFPFLKGGQYPKKEKKIFSFLANFLRKLDGILCIKVIDMIGRANTHNQRFIFEKEVLVKG